MNINLDIPIGTYRELTSEEFKALSVLISDSKKTFQANSERPKKNRR
jgi:23S rRNA pseudouridine2604 synthase